MTLDQIVSRFVLPVAVAVGLYACGSEEPTSSASNGIVSQPCHSDIECKEDRLCVDGYCTDAATNDDKDSCQVRETESCEDFTGVYERRRPCAAPDLDDYNFVSVVTYADCTIGLTLHNQSRTETDCVFSGHRFQASGNYLPPSIDGITLIKCRDQTILFNGNIDGTQCNLILDYISSDALDPTCETGTSGKR